MVGDLLLPRLISCKLSIEDIALEEDYHLSMVAESNVSYNG